MSAGVLLPDPGLLDILRGSADPATDGWHTSAFYDAARDEGVLPVVVDTVARRGWPGVGDQLRASLERERDAAVALATLSSMDLVRVLAALSAAGVHALVIKGAALAHTHYARPSLRPRIDTDLLIRARDNEAAHAVFRSLGAEYIPHVTGSYVMSQFHYATTDRAGCQHVYDVHWRIAKPQVFAAALSYEEIAAEAIGVPALGATARAPGTVHALLLACVHRAAHHGGNGPLIWLMDIHRLAGSLGDAESRGSLRRPRLAPSRPSPRPRSATPTRSVAEPPPSRSLSRWPGWLIEKRSHRHASWCPDRASAKRSTNCGRSRAAAPA